MTDVESVFVVTLPSSSFVGFGANDLGPVSFGFLLFFFPHWKILLLRFYQLYNVLY